jgi:hypothetical protein
VQTLFTVGKNYRLAYKHGADADAERQEARANILRDFLFMM